MMWPAAGVFVAALLGLGIFLSQGGDDDEERVDLFRVSRFEAGEAPQDVVVGGSTLWVTLALDRAVVRLDASTGEPIGDPQSVGETPVGIALGFSSAWVGFGEGATVVRIDETSGTVLNSNIVSGRSPHAIAVDDDSVWVAAIGEGRVSRIDPDRAINAAQEIFRAGGKFPSDIATGFGRVWVTDVVSGVVTSVDPDDTKKQEEVKVGESPVNVVTGEDAMWVANQNFGDGTLMRVDPDTLKVTDTIEIGGEISGLAFGEGYVWVTQSDRARLVRVNPETKEIDGEPIHLGQPKESKPLGLAVANGSVYIADQATGEVIRVELNPDIG